MLSNHRITESGCWEWQGSTNAKGYGLYRNKKAHRAVWEILRGPIPEGLTLDHLCRNPPCVNPEHLEPVTRAVNNERSNSPSAVNARKTECSNGHLLPERTGPGKRKCKPCRAEINRAWRANRTPEKIAADKAAQKIRSHAWYESNK